MSFKDLREFLNKLEEMGELKRITTEVERDKEIAGIAQEALVRGAPATLFENIKGHKETPGRKVVINTLSNYRRIAIAFGLPEDTHPKDILHVYRQRIKMPIKPMMVSTGPCKEVIKKGKDVNIFEFPITAMSPREGRSTRWQCCVTKDPETGWVNVGMYNSLLLEKNLTTVSPVRTQHMAIHARKYEAMGKSMPYAIAIGIEPMVALPACAPFKAGVNEFDMAGALRQSPVELVKCETVDLEVPASAEIVIEGTVNLDPSTYVDEGPMARYTGRYTSLFSGNLCPVLNISCITHRKDPIYLTIPAGTGPDLVAGETDYAVGIQGCAMIWEQLEESGVEGVTGVWTDPDTCWSNVFVSIDKKHYGHARQVATAIWAAPRLTMLGKYVIVVDSDVDIHNLKKINSAIAQRTRGQRDILFFPYSTGSPLDPGIDPEIVQKAKIGSWDRMLIDATWPFEWEPRDLWGGLNHPPSCLAEPETIEMVSKRWKEYGF